MNKNKIEAYSFYKELHPGAIILFHVGQNYVALFDDAKRIAEFFSKEPTSSMDEYIFPDSEMRLISQIGELGPVEIVDYRNDDREFDYPDIARIKREIDEDY